VRRNGRLPARKERGRHGSPFPCYGIAEPAETLEEGCYLIDWFGTDAAGPQVPVWAGDVPRLPSFVHLGDGTHGTGPDVVRTCQNHVDQP
jgi:hypothetical protein